MKIVTAAIIHNSEGKILICRRGPGQKQEGFWEFPGGKLLDGESVQDCVMRELQEELGISVQAGDILGESLYQYSHGAIQLIALACELIHGTPELRVHDRLEWVQPFSLLDYDLSPADIPLARQLMKP